MPGSLEGDSGVPALKGQETGPQLPNWNVDLRALCLGLQLQRGREGWPWAPGEDGVGRGTINGRERVTSSFLRPWYMMGTLSRTSGPVRVIE